MLWKTQNLEKIKGQSHVSKYSGVIRTQGNVYTLVHQRWEGVHGHGACESLK